MTLLIMRQWAAKCAIVKIQGNKKPNKFKQNKKGFCKKKNAIDNKATQREIKTLSNIDAFRRGTKMFASIDLFRVYES